MFFWGGLCRNYPETFKSNVIKAAQKVTRQAERDIWHRGLVGSMCELSIRAQFFRFRVQFMPFGKALRLGKIIYLFYFILLLEKWRK